MAESKSVEVKRKHDEREKYYRRKEKLVELEKKNFDKVIFTKATGGFWVVVGHSAVILTNLLGKEAKVRVPLKRDTDFAYRFKEGKVSVKNFEYYRKWIIGGNLATLANKKEDSVVFKLKKKLSEEEYTLLAQARELQRQQFEHDVLKAITMPQSHANLTSALRVAFRMYSKYTEKSAKEVFGLKLVEEIRMAHKIFLLVCMEELPFDTGLKKIREILTRALAGTTQMVELDLWTIEDTMAMATAIVQTKMSLEREEKMVKKLLAKIRTEEMLNNGETEESRI